MGNCCSNDKIIYQNDTRKLQLSKFTTEKLSLTDFNEFSTNFNHIHSNESILKNYKIQNFLGKGFFSKVYLAENSNKDLVALKIIDKRNFSSISILRKFLIEKEILKQIRSQFILKLFKTIQSKDKIYYELEFASLGNLQNALNNEVKFELEDIREISAQIILGIFQLHSCNIIYGDLKAENVLISEKGRIKLCDFNLSGTPSIFEQSKGNYIQGTCAYFAPEIINQNPICFKSDFWALGILLFLIRFQKYPFDCKNKTQLYFNISKRILNPCFEECEADLKDLIDQLLQLDKKKRFGQNLAQFQNHKFFKGLNWDKIQEPGYFFSYKLKLQDLIQSNRGSLLNQSIGDDKSKSKFHYLLDDFSYKRSEDEKSQTQRNISFSDLDKDNDSINTFKQFQVQI